MGGRYDIAQRVKELLEASDPLNYGDGQRAGSIELSPPPELSPEPQLSARAAPPLPPVAPPAEVFVARVPPPIPPPPARPTASPAAARPLAAAQPAPTPLGADELAELAALVREQRTIMAVRRYREMTGAGLADAKAAVELLAVRIDDLDLAPPPAPREAPAPATFAAPVPARRSLAPDMDLLAEEMVRLVQQGRKIEAIKRYREVTDCDLREAKDAVEAIEERLNAWPR